MTCFSISTLYDFKSEWRQYDISVEIVGARWYISFARVHICSAGLGLSASFDRASSKMRTDVTVILKSYLGCRSKYKEGREQKQNKNT